MIRIVNIYTGKHIGQRHTIPSLLMLVIVAAAILSILDCSENGGNDDAGNTTSNVEIEWLDPGPNEPIIKYIYSSGVIAKMLFYQKFEVKENSGTLRITARIEEGTGNMDLLDEQSYSADVESGVDYKITVTVDISGMGSCSPTDKDLMIFDSSSAPTTNEIYIFPTFNVDWNWWECVRRYSISEISIQHI